ncbi:MAG: HlyD family efflux transporter periplasmic adaptor subunit [Lachnospiraceae bacterium]|jgi:multidrug efflux pump subunit AcrA (membrane-fusion protein)|nr:HlyD family efflux transporter periplasmic adaptor subunit [Lachnospiraceae bacterium]
MNENGKSKREWVKTAAIIFLSVMLVLTFFSQTIMNYSLPEVATQYVQSGTITAKIRGTGVVESGDPYEVKVTESRKVSSVAVKVGDQVQKGDVLLYLEDAESEELKTAREALETAQKDYDMALLTAAIESSDIYSANQGVSTETLRQRITNAQRAVKTAEDELKAAQEAVKPLEQKVAELTKLADDCKAQLAYEEQQNSVAEQRVETAGRALETARANQQYAQTAYNAAKAAFDSATASGNDQALIEEKKKERDKAETALNNANNALNNAQNEYNGAVQNNTNRNNSQTINNLNSQKANYELQTYAVQKELDAATAAVKSAEAKVDEKGKALDELVSSVGNVATLEGKLDAIAKAQEKVDELTAKAVNATITADIAGTVTAINVTAGNTTSAATPVAVLQPEGKGYTLSFSVTNEQAKRLSVGDKADLVNAWRYDDVNVTLASIKPDKNNPGQNKMLTFDVTGSVTAGQTLNLSVGQKSANFDLIVPNSAIREDSNGKFILIVESKSSPLGNRYIATRVDIEVLASDDTQSAVSGGLYGYEYVITTSTKPVEAGKQVRLADN